MDAYNVLIIGSGPAGLFAAMELERRGIDRIAIVDRLPYTARHATAIGSGPSAPIRAGGCGRKIITASNW